MPATMLGRRDGCAAGNTNAAARYRYVLPQQLSDAIDDTSSKSDAGRIGMRRSEDAFFFTTAPQDSYLRITGTRCMCRNLFDIRKKERYAA